MGDALGGLYALVQWRHQRDPYAALAGVGIVALRAPAGCPAAP